MLFSKIFKLNGRNRWIEVSQKLLYSRKSSSNYKGSYKVVNKATNAVEGELHTLSYSLSNEFVELELVLLRNAVFLYNLLQMII